MVLEDFGLIYSFDTELFALRFRKRCIVTLHTAYHIYSYVSMSALSPRQKSTSTLLMEGNRWVNDVHCVSKRRQKRHLLTYAYSLSFHSSFHFSSSPIRTSSLALALTLGSDVYCVVQCLGVAVNVLCTIEWMLWPYKIKFHSMVFS